MKKAVSSVLIAAAFLVGIKIGANLQFQKLNPEWHYNKSENLINYRMEKTDYFFIERDMCNEAYKIFSTEISSKLNRGNSGKQILYRLEKRNLLIQNIGKKVCVLNTRPTKNELIYYVLDELYFKTPKEEIIQKLKKKNEDGNVDYEDIISQSTRKYLENYIKGIANDAVSHYPSEFLLTK